jgi:hypothetical protein
VASLTTKQASLSTSTDHGGGKRRAQAHCYFRVTPKIASVVCLQYFGSTFAMNSWTVARTSVAPFGLLLFAAVILASCSTSRTDTPTAEAAPPPLTQSKAAEQCWMETEHGAKSLPPEKRAKVVDQCVKDKMSGAK